LSTNNIAEKDLLLELDNLGQRMHSHGGKLEESMLERYRYFVEHSEQGRNCVYAKKCKELFLCYDYEDVRKQFLETLELFRTVEGETFGR
jgi:hypothetical protein